MVSYNFGKFIVYKDFIDDVLIIMLLEVDKFQFKERKEWCYINIGMVYIDFQDIVIGKVIFVVDVCEFKVLVVIIECFLVVGGKVKSFDVSKVKVVFGVVDIIEIFVFKGVL